MNNKASETFLFHSPWPTANVVADILIFFSPSFFFEYTSAKLDLIRLRTQSSFFPLRAMDVICGGAGEKSEHPLQNIPTCVPWVSQKPIKYNLLFKVEDNSAIIPIEWRFNTSIQMH